MKFSLYLAAVCAIGFSCVGLAAPRYDSSELKINLPVTKFQLKNGLTVLLHEDHSVPLVSYHTWYRVGSRDESVGVTGAAHMLEHMMFKGAKKYTGKDFDRVLHENGITNNAFTTSDYTGFFENLPSSKLELIMDMEVDRMRFLSLRNEDLQSELQVVGEERRMRVDNSPPGLLREAFNSTIYESHPYRWPTIGYMQDILQYTPAKLKKFYDEFYVPNNAVLVLAGDFETAKVRQMIEKNYGVLEPRPLAPRSYPKEAEPQKAKFKEVVSDVQATTFLVGYKGVEAGHADSYALDLLAAVLGSGSSSRLHKRLVYEKQTATSARAYNSTSADPGSFVLMTSLRPQVKWQRAKLIIDQEINQLRAEKISSVELQKVKNQVMKDFVDSLTTIDGKANALALNEILLGSYENMFSDLVKYNSVTADDVVRVAKKYLMPSRQVVVVLNPKAESKP